VGLVPNRQSLLEFQRAVAQPEGADSLHEIFFGSLLKQDAEVAL